MKLLGKRTALVSWIAALPLEISWRVPIGVVAVLLLGWLMTRPSPC